MRWPGMNAQQREERDPTAIQAELLEIDRQIEDAGPDLLAKTQAAGEAKAELEVAKLRLKLLKERRSGLQSVLKSVSVY